MHYLGSTGITAVVSTISVIVVAAVLALSLQALTLLSRLCMTGTLTLTDFVIVTATVPVSTSPACCHHHLCINAVTGEQQTACEGGRLCMLQEEWLMTCLALSLPHAYFSRPAPAFYNDQWHC